MLGCIRGPCDRKNAERTPAHIEPRSAAIPHTSGRPPSDSVQKYRTPKEYKTRHGCASVFSNLGGPLRSGREEALVEPPPSGDVGKDRPIREPLDRRMVVGQRVIRSWGDAGVGNEEGTKNADADGPG